MVRINHLFSMGNISNKINRTNNASKKEVPMFELEKGDGLDTVSFSGNKLQNWQDIAKEWKEYTDSIWNKPEPKFNTREEREQYWITYYDNYINYCDRVLSCINLPESVRSEWSRMKNNAMVDRNHHYRDLNNWEKENGLKTESFNDVIAEMRENVPDRTTTIGEKQLALSYIERMLSCDDIPNPEYWQNKRDIIGMEIAAIKNEEALQGDNDPKPFEEIQKEYDDFIQKYWNKNPHFDNVPDRVEYWVTYGRTCQSFIRRILACNNLPDDVRENYMAEYSNHQFDIDNHLSDLERYRQEHKE